VPAIDELPSKNTLQIINKILLWLKARFKAANASGDQLSQLSN